MNALVPIPTTFVPLTPRLRAKIEATIEELVAILDSFDGNPDEEPDDFEEDDDPAEDEGDREPDDLEEEDYRDADLLDEDDLPF